MIELLLTAWAPMLVAALAGAVAGWFWHAGRMRPRQKALGEERRKLRMELLDLAVGLPPQAPLQAVSPIGEETYRRRIIELEHALAEARGRGAEVDVLRARLADLEQHSHVRPVVAVDVTDYTRRIAALEVEIESARQKIAEAEALQARAASLEAAPPPAPPAPVDDESDLTKWRARYFEARTSYLEQTARASETEANALHVRIAALEARPAPPTDDAEKTQLIWRNRYLTERLKYVEGEGAAAAVTDKETDDRRRWRMRYLEQRLAHLESGGRAPAPPPEPAPPPVDTEPFKARIAELEGKISESEANATKLIDTEDEVIRARWTTRYLQARVKYLEERLGQAADDAARAAQAAEEASRAAKPAEAPKPIEIPAAPAPVRAPEPVVFRMERPPTLSGARNGAPDDFTLIDGVSPQSSAALHAMGVHHFDQIAAWTPAHVAWVNQYFNLGGRIAQHRWVEQAQKLASGG